MEQALGMESGKLVFLKSVINFSCFTAWLLLGTMAVQLCCAVAVEIVIHARVVVCRYAPLFRHKQRGKQLWGIFIIV